MWVPDITLDLPKVDVVADSLEGILAKEIEIEHYDPMTAFQKFGHQGTADVSSAARDQH